MFIIFRFIFGQTCFGTTVICDRQNGLVEVGIMQFEVGKVKSGKTLDRRSGRSKDVAYGKKEKMAAMAILAWQEELGASMATSGVTLWAKWHQNNQHVRNDSGRSGMDRKRGNTWPSGSPHPPLLISVHMSPKVLHPSIPS